VFFGADAVFAALAIACRLRSKKEARVGGVVGEYASGPQHREGGRRRLVPDPLAVSALVRIGGRDFPCASNFELVFVRKSRLSQRAPAFTFTITALILLFIVADPPLLF
jgi:hypothetical protein